MQVSGIGRESTGRRGCESQDYVPCVEGVKGGSCGGMDGGVMSDGRGSCPSI